MADIEIMHHSLAPQSKPLPRNGPGLYDFSFPVLPFPAPWSCWSLGLKHLFHLDHLGSTCLLPELSQKSSLLEAFPQSIGSTGDLWLYIVPLVHPRAVRPHFQSLWVVLTRCPESFRSPLHPVWQPYSFPSLWHFQITLRMWSFECFITNGKSNTLRVGLC